MPYIITTTRPRLASATFGGEMVGVGENVSRRAVATLDEARDFISVEIGCIDAGSFNAHCRIDNIEAQQDAITEHGGTVGPLPDGTVIQVEPVEYGALARMAIPRDVWWEAMSDDGKRQVIDAYNAAQEVR